MSSESTQPGAGRPDEAGVTVACLQFEPTVGAREENVSHSLDLVARAVRRGARLVVMPELSSSGYVFESRAEAFSLSEPAVGGPSIEAWSAIAAKHGLHIVAGFCERDGQALFNSAAVIGPDGLLGVYRKHHLWGEENLYFEPGDSGFPVFATPIGRIAALICYDCWFPEAWRLCALQGADIVCVPTNWVPMPNQPSNHYSMSNVLCMSAAHSNSLFIAAADRVGVERGQPFIGQSIIVGHDGWIVAGPASADEPETLIATCNLADARRRRQLNDFNQILRDRRSDVYGEMLGTSISPGWY